MKSRLLFLFVILGLIGCTQYISNPPTPKIKSILKHDFSAEFDRLFLSDDPLRYQDNVAFLDAICSDELSNEEKNLVTTKLAQFLSADIQIRGYAPDSIHTGVASEIAFLRLQAIRLLANVGTKNEVAFIQDLRNNPEGEHPLFEDECNQAIDKLNDR